MPTPNKLASRAVLIRIYNAGVIPKFLYRIEIMSINENKFEKSPAPLYHAASFLTHHHTHTHIIVTAAGRCLEQGITADALIERAKTPLIEVTGQRVSLIAKNHVMETGNSTKTAEEFIGVK